MTSTLIPVEAVRCPSTGKLVLMTKCDECPLVIEVRRPWRHFAVKCKVGGESQGVYP